MNEQGFADEQGLVELWDIYIENHPDLTKREREILTLMLTSKAPKEFAKILKVSYHTVDFHRKNLYRKLGVKSRVELFTRYAKLAV